MAFALVRILTTGVTSQNEEHGNKQIQRLDAVSTIEVILGSGRRGRARASDT
jgi:hypothetical protein